MFYLIVLTCLVAFPQITHTCVCCFAMDSFCFCCCACLFVFGRQIRTVNSTHWRSEIREWKASAFHRRNNNVAKYAKLTTAKQQYHLWLAMLILTNVLLSEESPKAKLEHGKHFSPSRGRPSGLGNCKNFLNLFSFWIDTGWLTGG